MAKNLSVFAFTALLVGGPSLWALQQAGFTEESFNGILRTSARIALLIYLVIFVTRPVHQLVTAAWSRALLRNRRLVGIAFASVMTVHLVFLVWLNGIQLAIPGMVAFAFVYLMFVTSFDGPAGALGARRWRLLHRAGIYYIGVIFSVTVVTGLMASPGEPVYVALAVLMLSAIGVRVAAFLRRRRAAAGA